MPTIQPPLLDFRNLRVMRGQKIALDDFSLRIGADEHVAILGPNGCGKSTLIKTITRECYPVARPESSMSILGQESWDVFELRAGLGIVSNDLMLSCTGEAMRPGRGAFGIFQQHRDLSESHRRSRATATLADAALAGIEDLASGGTAGMRDVVGRGAARADRPRAGAQAARVAV